MDLSRLRFFVKNIEYHRCFRWFERGDLFFFIKQGSRARQFSDVKMYKMLVQPSFSAFQDLDLFYIHFMMTAKQIHESAHAWFRSLGLQAWKRPLETLLTAHYVLTIHSSTWGWKTIVWKVWSFCLKLVHSAFFNKILRPNHLRRNLQFWLLLHVVDVFF